MQRVIGDALATWPELPRSADGFETHVRALGATVELLALHGRELYLAFAASNGHPGALKVLEREYFPRIAQVVARVNREPVFVDEVRQLVLERLLIGSPPRIAQYGATGPLAAWLRVMSSRVALNHVKARGSREVPLVEALVDPAVVSTSSDALREAVAASIGKAFTTLSPRERNVFRLHYLEELNIDRIGGLYRVHRATVARWIAHGKLRILELVEKDLQVELKLSASEVRSVLAGVQSQLDVSISQILRVEGAHGEDAEIRPIVAK